MSILFVKPKEPLSAALSDRNGKKEKNRRKYMMSKNAYSAVLRTVMV